MNAADRIVSHTPWTDPAHSTPLCDFRRAVYRRDVPADARLVMHPDTFRLLPPNTNAADVFGKRVGGREGQPSLRARLLALFRPDVSHPDPREPRFLDWLNLVLRRDGLPGVEVTSAVGFGRVELRSGDAVLCVIDAA